MSVQTGLARGGRAGSLSPFGPVSLCGQLFSHRSGQFPCAGWVGRGSRTKGASHQRWERGQPASLCEAPSVPPH